MSRIAVAWISSISRSWIRPWRASSTSGERRISAITSSSMSSALTRPRRMGGRSSALRGPKLGPGPDDVDLVGDPVADELVDRQGPRDAVDEREHVRAEVGLQLGVLEQ